MQKQPVKKCGRCGVTKERSEFYEQKTGTDKLAYKCKKCTAEMQARRTLAWRNIPDGCNWCYHCKMSKSFSEFHRNRTTKNGHTSICKKCNKKRDKIAYPKKRGKQIAQAMAWNKRHPERYKNIQLRRSYGITLGEYNVLLAAQGGVCAICGRSSVKALSVDHDASTGRIRGLLCQTHNMALGNFEHNSAFLRAAADYMDRANNQELLRSPQPEE